MGREGVTAVLHSFFQTAFSNPTITLQQTQADEESVLLTLVLAGQQVTPFWGLPCTGRTVTLEMKLGCRFYGEQITHVDLHYDPGVLLRQLGLAL